VASQCVELTIPNVPLSSGLVVNDASGAAITAVCITAHANGAGG
jgi:hypothetical protein